MYDRPLTQRQLDVMTIEQYWREMMPEIPVPEDRYLRSYLNKASVARVMELIDAASKIEFTNYNRAGMWLNDRLQADDMRRLAKVNRVDQSGVIRFDRNGQRVA